LNKSKAIKLKCLDCSGGSPKEVTLCSIFDCPLWPYRTGNSLQSKICRKRIEAAFRNFPDDIKALQNQDVDIGFLRRYSSKSQHRENNFLSPKEFFDAEDAGHNY